jgi:hypothetical protein
MKRPTTAERLAAVERQIAELRHVLVNGSQEKDWRSTIGMFTGDKVMKQIDEQARKIREADRRKARRQQQRKKLTN